MKKEFKVGQRWLTRGGHIAEITLGGEYNPSTYCVTAVIPKLYRTCRYTVDGLLWDGESNELDLMSLVEDDPQETTEKKYTIDEFINFFIQTGWVYAALSDTLKLEILEIIKKTEDPEYAEYLRLHEIYGGTK